MTQDERQEPHDVAIVVCPAGREENDSRESKTASIERGKEAVVKNQEINSKEEATVPPRAAKNSVQVSRAFLNMVESLVKTI